jgi:2-polyprenyl-3-methyl-5-hydroxy-6-metoxy-1,4-benzoquinol methylase
VPSEVEYWNWWNAEHREASQGNVSRRQAEVVEAWLSGRRELRLLDVGCGSGWMCERLLSFGSVTGTDLADEVVERARDRLPAAQFFAGDFATVDVGVDYDVIVALEVLSHVADQPAFMQRVASLLVVGGELMLATQNRPILERFNRIPPPGPGQRRQWVDKQQVARLMSDAGLRVLELRTVSPIADHGLMRYVTKAARLTRTERVLERFGFGWTIMARAVKPS